MACDSSSSCLRVLDTAVVTPSGPPLPPSSFPLTFLDLQWIHSPPVERIFFYHIGAHHADLVVSSLKASLSTALRAFFPLAGRLRATTATGRPDILYKPGDGVTFTLAEYDADLSDLASDHHPRQVAELAQLVPRLQHTHADGGAALLSVQATLLLPHGDLALGVTVHHAACDGVGSTSFLHTWAAACAGPDKPLPPAPVIDRTLIAEPPGLYNHYMNNLPSTDEIEFVKMEPDQLLATFTLSSEQLQCVKDAVAGEAARLGQTPPRCSTLVAALGFIWSCYRRAKAETDDGAADPESPTYFIVPVDHRQLMKPPVPATYLGNCIGPAIGAAAKGELASAGAEGLFTACAAIATGIEKAVATPGWETMVERVKEAGACGVLSVARWPGRRGCVCTTSTSGSGPRRRWRSCPWRGPGPWRWRRGAEEAWRWACRCRRPAWRRSGGASPMLSRGSRHRTVHTLVDGLPSYCHESPSPSMVSSCSDCFQVTVCCAQSTS